MGKRHRHGEHALTTGREFRVEGLAADTAASTPRGRGQRPTATVLPLSGLENAGKTDVQLKANVEKQDRAKRGKNDSGGMKSSGWRRKQVGNRAADDRSDDAEHDCPENRHVHMHHRFRNNSGDQPNNNVPD